MSSRRSGKVSIIIVTHNALEYVERCLKSVTTHTAEQHEIIVVDNASRQPTRDYLLSIRERGRIQLILNQENRLWSPANNQGLRSIAGDSEFCLLLNSDVEVFRSDWLDILKEPMHKDSRIGITGTQFNFLPIKPTYGAIDGCCFMFRRKLTDEVGYLDEDYPWNGAAYVFVVNAWSRGWRFYHVDDPSILVHYGKKSRIVSQSQLKNIKVDHFNMIRGAGLKPRYDILAFLKYRLNAFDINKYVTSVTQM